MGSLSVQGLGKAYKQYPSKVARLAEWLLPWGGVRHRSRWVLKDVSLSISAGEAVGILGLNGAGKSTLLKMIAGTTSPSEGHISRQGSMAALLELGIGFHPDFTGRQNVFLSGQLLGLGRSEIEGLLPHIESFAEIGDYLDQPVRVYSSGMQVRLAFALATAIRPDILIVDEALAVGDIFFQQRCFERIRKFQKQGTTLLLVSHSMETICSLCQRAILLDGSRVALDGETKKVVDLYNTLISQRTFQSELKRSVQAQSPGVAGASTDTSNAERSVAIVKIDSRDGSYSSSTVEIASVELLVDGKSATILRQGIHASLSVAVQFLRSLSDPHLGFQLRDARGGVIYMSTTAGLGLVLGPVSEGDERIVQFNFPIEMACGEYTITVGVSNQAMEDGSFNEQLLRRQNALKFTVAEYSGTTRWAGIYNIKPVCSVLSGANE